MVVVERIDVLATKRQEGFSILRTLTSGKLWLAVYFFVIFQASLYLIKQAALADFSLFWSIGALALGLFAVFHSLVVILQQLDQGPYDLTRKWLVFLSVMVLYVYVFAISFVVLFLGFEPTIQPNQESVDIIMNNQRLLMLFMTIIVAPVVEELVFRELLPAAMGFAPIGFILSSVLFVVLHAPAGITGWLVYSGISAVLLFLRLQGGNVLQAVSGHILYNLLSVLLGLVW